MMSVNQEALSLDEAIGTMLARSEWFGTDIQHPLFKAGVVVLMGVNRRKHLTDMVRLTGYDREFVQTTMQNLRNSKVWYSQHSSTFSNWEETGGAEFIMDVFTAAGLISRSSNCEQVFA